MRMKAASVERFVEIFDHQTCQSHPQCSTLLPHNRTPVSHPYEQHSHAHHILQQSSYITNNQHARYRNNSSSQLSVFDGVRPQCRRCCVDGGSVTQPRPEINYHMPRMFSTIRKRRPCFFSSSRRPQRALMRTQSRACPRRCAAGTASANGGPTPPLRRTRSVR